MEYPEQDEHQNQTRQDRLKKEEGVKQELEEWKEGEHSVRKTADMVKVCPVMSIHSQNFQVCIRDRCMWYNPVYGKCGMLPTSNMSRE